MFIFRVGVLFIAFIHHLQPTLPLPSPPHNSTLTFHLELLYEKKKPLKAH